MADAPQSLSPRNEPSAGLIAMPAGTDALANVITTAAKASGLAGVVASLLVIVLSYLLDLGSVTTSDDAVPLPLLLCFLVVAPGLGAFVAVVALTAPVALTLRWRAICRSSARLVLIGVLVGVAEGIASNLAAALPAFDWLQLIWFASIGVIAMLATPWVSDQSGRAHV